jgi:hypothetical protein
LVGASASSSQGYFPSRGSGGLARQLPATLSPTEGPVKLEAAAGAERSRSKACAWLLKKVFGILRKFARANIMVAAIKQGLIVWNRKLGNDN